MIRGEGGKVKRQNLQGYRNVNLPGSYAEIMQPEIGSLAPGFCMP